GIRSRGTFSRTFGRVTALEEEARQRWQEREQALVQSLQETRSKLSQLQTEKAQGQEFILSPQQQHAIEQFREEEIRINGELKQVRKNLRQEIERLGLKVKVANVTLMPLVVAIAGLLYWAAHRRKR
ncbi:MAG: hypothetical protein O3A51_04840, partial [Verrucomicrobia bacterium]|nr:hypothetical protein [Verrucomicrobiota bacterium]